MRDAEFMDAYLVLGTGKGGEEDSLALFDDFIQFREGSSQNDPSPVATVLLHIRGKVSHEERGLASSSGTPKEQLGHKRGPNRLFLGAWLRLPDFWLIHAVSKCGVVPW
jgi:hypothetical protein